MPVGYKSRAETLASASLPYTGTLAPSLGLVRLGVHVVAAGLRMHCTTAFAFAASRARSKTSTANRPASHAPLVHRPTLTERRAALRLTAPWPAAWLRTTTWKQPSTMASATTTACPLGTPMQQRRAERYRGHGMILDLPTSTRFTYRLTICIMMARSN